MSKTLTTEQYLRNQIQKAADRLQAVINDEELDWYVRSEVRQALLTLREALE